MLKPIVIAAALAVNAQTRAPGLWDHTFAMSSPGGEMRGKWLGPECGDLKPISSMAGQ